MRWHRAARSGIVVIGGLTSSLFLTLILIPVVYVWLSPTRLRARRPVAPAQLRPLEEERVARKSGHAAL